MDQHMGKIIIIVGICFFLWICKNIWKFKRIIENDKAFRKYNNDGKIIQEVYNRPIWDYHFFPGLSKVWHMSQWQPLLAIVILVFLLVLYLFIKDDKLLNLVSVNLGTALGMMIRQKTNK